MFDRNEFIVHFLAMISASFIAVPASRENMMSPPETLGKL